MMIQNSGRLLYALLQATRPSDVEVILQAIGDHPDLGVDEPFGDLGYQWHFVGDNPSNMSTINLASKPGRSLTERVTNAIDALLERGRYAHQEADEPESPMAAAQTWFGRPPTRVNSGLYQLSDSKRDIMADLIQVILAPGDESGKPTIDVLDRGIGIQPEAFDQTILSFHQGNKINKPYLAGAFGQGGSSTIAFSDYTLIVSRHIDGHVTGFTLVKQKELGEGYKENAYVYLAVSTPDGDLSVPHIDSEAGIDLYPAIKRKKDKPNPLVNGTVVRHYGYQLGALDKPLSTSPGNLYHLFEYMLFDPVLPFQLVDLRNADDPKHLIVIGSRNRLMDEQEHVDIRHHQPKFWIRPLSGEAPSLGVEYWVVFSSIKQNGQEPSQRARPNDLFLDPAHPIVGTLNGQNHGELTNRILREAKLPQVAKHLVVHLDLSHVSKRVRSQLLSSTREGFKDGGPLDEITRVLKDHFRDDDHLQAIETELQNMLMGGDDGDANAEVKLQITRLLKDVGLDYGDYGQVPVTLNGSHKNGKRLSRTQRLQAAQPVDTLPYPQVSQFEIVSPHEVLRIRQGDSRLLKVETDADLQFDQQGDIQIQVEPDHLVDIAKGALIGGRIQWRLRPRQQSEPGQFGQVIVSLTLPDGGVLEDHIPYEVLPPREQGIRTERGLVPNFDIQGVDPEESPDHFFRVWDYLDPAVDDLSMVSYKVVEVGSSIIVYYSTAFGPYRKRWDAIMQKQPELASQFVQNYEIWVGYYAIIQWQQRLMDESIDATQVDETLLERLYNRESALVAEVQAKQALEVADLQRRFTDVV